MNMCKHFCPSTKHCKNLSVNYIVGMPAHFYLNSQTLMALSFKESLGFLCLRSALLIVYKHDLRMFVVKMLILIQLVWDSAFLMGFQGISILLVP